MAGFKTIPKEVAVLDEDNTFSGNNTFEEETKTTKVVKDFITVKTGLYLTGTTETVLVNPSSNITVYLPSSPTTGTVQNIKNISSLYSVTVHGNTSTIDGVSTFVLSPYERRAFMWDKTDWYTI